MTVRTDFPHQVREVEHITMRMSDGVALAARLWLPESASREPVPAILEFIPYRKRDFTAYRDAVNHRWFAGHGYACVRVDMRGSGDSEGVLLDEYIEQEQEDGLEIIRWIRRQDWCDGKVGMFGISWGGFNGLQIAARQPPGLEAVVSVASTDDRYADDVHYMGGCLLGDNLSWASIMFAYNASPPDPAVVGERWKQMWVERMSKSGLWVENWLEHQRRDEFWKHGSVCEDFSQIRAPVFAVSGWADGYSNAVFRLLAGLESPCIGLVGPWSHRYPHLGVPGPAIGFLQECLRWWDFWLKRKETGIMDEAKLRVWMQDYVPPSHRYEERPGRWAAEESWPSPNVSQARWFFGPRGLLTDSETPANPSERADLPTIQSPLGVGQFAGKWCSYSETPDLPGDQREEDGGALVWETEPLADAIEVLGAVRLRLRLKSNRETGTVAVRLSDVAEDGKATRVTYGVLNLTHRESHETPEPLRPGVFYDVEVRLNDCGHRFETGHRVRISLSTSLWPLIWAPKEQTMLTVDPAKSTVTIPLRSPRKEDASVGFAPPERASGIARTTLEAGEVSWNLERDLGTDRSVMRVRHDGGTVRFDDIDLVTTRSAYEEYSHQGDDIYSVAGTTLHERSWKRGGWEASIRAHTSMECDRDFFYISADLDAWEGHQRIFCKSWNERIPRDLV